MQAESLPPHMRNTGSPITPDSPSSGDSQTMMIPAAPPHPWDTVPPRWRTGERLVYFFFYLLILIPLLIVRLLILAIAAIFMFAALLSPRDAAYVAITNCAGRLMLCAFGVWPGLLTIIGRERFASAPVAVVAPHVGLLDACFFIYRDIPRPIALEPYTKIPLIGWLFRRANGIAVPLPKATDARKPPPGRKIDIEPPDATAADTTSEMPPVGESKHGSAAKATPTTLAVRLAIQQHKKTWEVANGEASKSSMNARLASRPILILPEGTTHNGHAILRFFTGAFEGGGPVQPILLQYPQTRFSRGFGSAAFFASGLGAHLFNLLTCAYQPMNVRYLPVHQPTAEEEADADLYAENVRRSMAEAARLPLSTYGARELRKEMKEGRIYGKHRD